MAKSGISTPHDDLFRALLSDRERAGAFLRDHLPNEIAGHLQSDPPEIVESYILRNLSALDVDTLSLDPALRRALLQCSVTR